MLPEPEGEPCDGIGMVVPPWPGNECGSSDGTQSGFFTSSWLALSVEGAVLAETRNA